jgi:hypothetical protein
MRTSTVHPSVAADKSAQFMVGLRKGPKVDEVKFLSGAEELRKAESAIAALKYDVEFPDDGSTRLIRRGILSCSELRQDGMFVVYPVIASSVPQPTPGVGSRSGE